MHPQCSHCSYDLTGAIGIRCPECGRLFIEAGVHLGPPPGPQLRSIGKVALAMFFVLTALYLSLSAATYFMTKPAIEKAASQQQAAQARAKALSKQVQKNIEATEEKPDEDGHSSISDADQTPDIAGSAED